MQHYAAYFAGGNLDLSKKILDKHPRTYYHSIALKDFHPIPVPNGEIPIQMVTKRETYKLHRAVRGSGMREVVLFFVHEHVLDGVE